MATFPSALIETVRRRGVPSELLHKILNGQGSEFLDALAQTSLNYGLTETLLPYYVNTAADISQRWMKLTNQADLSSCVKLASCFARTLPFLPYLQPSVRDFLKSSRVFHHITLFQSTVDQLDSEVLSSLTALFRLLSHDLGAFEEFVKPVDLCALFSHELPYVRYLAVQCFCKVMRFADALNQDLITKHVGAGVVLGEWEDCQIDYRLFLLHEEQRWRSIGSMLKTCNAEKFLIQKDLDIKLAAGAVSIAGVIVPRPADVVEPKSSYIQFASSTLNLQAAAKTLLRRKPTLLVGTAGSGKTAIVRELAHQTGSLSGLITLHLNDQTDAKSLLGIYTSSVDGSGFTWQPGVLTKAITEGRWLLIEDIDRAPTEIIGLLRPLIENEELLLPSRKQKIKANDGFRIFATMRSSSTIASHSVRGSFLSNPRMWQTVETLEYSREEVELLLTARFSSILSLLPGVLAAHFRLVTTYATNPSFKAFSSRLPGIKDLIKWCRRLVQRYRFSSAGSRGLMPETFMVDAFKDGLDCYTALLSEKSLSDVLAYSIAEGLNIAPNIAKHTLEQQNPIVQENKSQFQIGRSTLIRSVGSRPRLQASRFALTKKVRQNMEAIVSAVSMTEPLLLVGETGVGKTTILQYIASRVGSELTVVNLSNQSEASDLLGGLKPVTTRSLVVPLIDEFNDLFDKTFSASKNAGFRNSVTKAFQKQRWTRLISHWEGAIQLASRSLNISANPTDTGGLVAGREHGVKRRKVDDPKYDILRQNWTVFASNVSQVKMQVQKGDQNQIFAFVESRLVKAVRTGGWLLLDEINLASSETLDNIVSLLRFDDGDLPYLLLAEAGNVERIDAHSNFRIFAAMNPATDTGKKDLPIALRSHFTELYVEPGDTNVNDLVEIVSSYLDAALHHDKKAAHDLSVAYLTLKELNAQHKLTDGAGDLPHFSLRSLTRCLQYVQQNHSNRGLRRAMLDGIQMTFFTVLDTKSQELALPAIEASLFGSLQARRALQSQRQRFTIGTSRYVVFDDHAVIKGPLEADTQSYYILTKSVRRNLVYLARAASMSKFPILLQGPTSAGKTSMVEYLARYSGNKFVRINNHEHTDLQEYLGSYTSGSDGKLEFSEGVLVEALRNGHWIVLDELNLAPSDVLEALNRLLDDNRELLIPETQEVVRPHPNFMLFATQNPAGLYGGRKRFSRAFRNRFLEIHVDDIPEGELKQILSERTKIAPKFCELIVEVYKKLSLQRSSSRLFEARNSFATLRDLFRWASRPVDDRMQLATHGYMLLAERVREPAEKIVVKQTIEETLKVKIDEDVIYHSIDIPLNVPMMQDITWTRAMRRLYTLITSALKNNEPVLLVGETGCGKTQVCQCIAAAFQRPLNIYNAHSNTETGDLIGSQRPVRHKTELAEAILQSIRDLGEDYDQQRRDESIDMSSLISQFKAMDTSKFDQSVVENVKRSIAAYQSLFVWSDGTLVRAMKDGCHFLLDEISLADDSVLERMNSVLEPSRTILLAEKGAEENLVVAKPDFQFLATMNPGGDYGKRELSAALRNRLTEIWVPPLCDDEDVVPILKNRMLGLPVELASSMVSFAKFFQMELQPTSKAILPLRLLLNWADFVVRSSSLTLAEAVVHGAAMTFIDGLGANPAGLSATVSQNTAESRAACLASLASLFELDALTIYHSFPTLSIDDSWLHFGQFRLGRSPGCQLTQDLNFDAVTTLRNASRIVRALQTSRPILLEGNPGVGKTAIVGSLAKLCGRPLTRINLSDQTDLMDLFGADTPAEGEGLGNFIWRDGPLLRAMQSGEWVLLDEMNLASQSVLEGLNACLDHRKEIYVAELDRTFQCHPGFTLFATQNPHAQGGGRKGLPASFVNRFTVVYADPFTSDDLVSICSHKHPSIPTDQILTTVSVIDQCQQLALRSSDFSEGGPWELNLRDLDRWLSLYEKEPNLSPASHFDTVVCQRFRNRRAKDQLHSICIESFGNANKSLYHTLTKEYLQIGTALVTRNSSKQPTTSHTDIPLSLLDHAKSFLVALDQNWPIILTGRSGSGKTKLIRSLAALVGADLVEFSTTSDVDTTDLIGGYDQFTADRALRDLQSELQTCINDLLADRMSSVEQMQMFLTLFERVQRNVFNSAEMLTVLNQLLDTLPRTRHFDRIQALLAVVQRIDGSQRAAVNQFVWTDGILIDALQKGSWLILDHANLCNPSVLDRLNSLLEPDGCLILSEAHTADGHVRLIKPAQGFRIILTMNPGFGDLSRAMRNRSLEISLDDVTVRMDDVHLPSYSESSAITRIRPLLHERADAAKAQDLEPWLNQLTQVDISILNEQPVGTLPPLLREEISLYTKQDSLTSRYIETRLVHFKNASHSVKRAYWPFLVPINEPLQSHLLGTADLLNMGSATRSQLLNMVLEHGRRELTAIGKSVYNADTRNSYLVRTSPPAMSQTRTKSHLIPAFSVLSNLGTFVSATMQNDHQLVETPKSFGLVRDVVQLLQDLIDFFNQSTVDSVQFQSYLQVVDELGTRIHIIQPKLSQGYLDSIRSLGQLAKLSNGQGLRRMWPRWRAPVSRSREELDVRLSLEALIQRFDGLAKVLPQTQAHLAGIRLQMVNVLDKVLSSDDSSGLIASLESAVGEMTSQMHTDSPTRGHFASTVGKILYKARIQGIDIEPLKCQLLVLLSDRRNLEGSQATKSRPETPLELLNTITGSGFIAEEEGGGGSDGHLLPGEVGLHDLVRRFQSSIDQPLGHLKYAQEEMQQVVTLICSMSKQLCTPNTNSIIRLAQQLLAQFLESHQDPDSQANWNGQNLDIGSEDTISILETLAVGSANLMPDAQAHIKILCQEFARLVGPAGNYPSVHADCGRLLIRLAITCLRSFVPDQKFDPASFYTLLNMRHNRRRAELEYRLGIWSRFQKDTTGHLSSFATRIIEEDLQELGEAIQIPPVFRPTDNGFQNLCTEFINLLRNVVNIDIIDEILGGDNSRARTLLQRVRGCLDRLSQAHRAYDDLVKPITGLLQTLSLGLRMTASNSHKACDRTQHELSIMDLAVHNKTFPIAALNNVSIIWVYLDQMRLRLRMTTDAQAVQHLTMHTTSVIDLLYVRWRNRLDQDTELAEQQARYYSYRGDEDMEPTELDVRAVFPSFEEDEAPKHEPSTKDESLYVKPHAHAQSIEFDVRSSGITLSKYIRGIHTPSDTQELLQSSIKTLLSAHDGVYGAADTEESVSSRAMSALILEMDEQLKKLASQSPIRTINIYTDHEFIETQKLFDVSYNAQKRFREISEQWPDHTVPVDVIRFCAEVMSLAISTPVAKLMTKAEKMLEVVSQWQAVASREWSVSNILDALTNLIIHWRRLELASWSRLLDNEDDSVQAEVDSWSFIAYESIVYNPRKLVQDEAGLSHTDMSDFCTKLASTLQDYLQNTTLGQFSRRLDLLDAMNKTLRASNTRKTTSAYGYAMTEQSAVVYDGLQPIIDSISNTVTHFRRYEPQVTKNLQEGRKALGKKINDQIQLASWKDTNITALRESAHRSHFKLFKVVKQYRNLVHQPLPLLNAGLDLKIEHAASRSLVRDFQSSKNSIEADILICQDAVPDWSQRPQRLQDTIAAAKTMQYVYSSSLSAFSAAHELQTWTEDLNESTKELGRATPSITYDDNSSIIRDLKQRKRRLLADTLKQIAAFGIRRNLGTDELMNQASSAVVLSSVPQMSSSTFDTLSELVDHRFHALVDAVPPARNSVIEHSGDLTDGEVQRSLGYLEGGLNLAIRQRRALGIANREHSELTAITRALMTLLAARREIQRSTDQHTPKSRRISYLLDWLPQLLKLYSKVVTIQVHYGAFDAQYFADTLAKYGDDFRSIAESFSVQKCLPTGLVSTIQMNLETEFESLLEQLHRELITTGKVHPQIEHVCHALQEWTKTMPLPADHTNGVAHPSPSQVDGNVRECLDSIFVALQNSSDDLKMLPMARDSTAWLTKSTQIYQKAFGSLQCVSIQSRIERIHDTFKSVEPEDLQISVALVVTALPIMSQYQAILEDMFYRMLVLHGETCNTFVYLSTTFATLAKEGFCSPSGADKGDDKTGKVDQGTGLGEGDAAEDISKDVGEDEDLTELAQEPGEHGENYEMEQSKDAVDMGTDDLEGDMGSGDELASDDEAVSDPEDDADRDMDEETGEIDDLDPAAVDEKLWDEKREEAEQNDKEMKSEKGHGEKTEEQTARDDQVEPDDSQDDMGGDNILEKDEKDGEQKAEGDQLDQHLQEEEKLDLPDNMQLNGEEEQTQIEGSDMDDLSDADEDLKTEDNVPADLPDEEMIDRDGSIKSDEEIDADEDGVDQARDIQDEEMLQHMDEEMNENDRTTREDDQAVDTEDHEAGDSGIANNQVEVEDENAPQGQNSAETAVKESKAGQKSESSAQQEDGASSGILEQGTGHEDQKRDKQENALQRLADMLEKFHQRREIFTQNEEQQQIDQDVNMEDADFEHLGSERDESEFQALGNADHETRQNFDARQAIEDSRAETDEDLPMPDDAEDFGQSAEESLAQRMNRIQEEHANAEEHGRDTMPGVVAERIQALREDRSDENTSMEEDELEQVPDLDDKANVAETIFPSSTSIAEAQQLWSLTTNKTQALSLTLTEQLRLILQPTTATKLRGDFRTGKRLNIRRIIPYIASGFKRDKIWMRRSIPSKRNYQVMLAVDDSRSMAESGADILALETLCMLSRSLSMLEVGELSVVAFGQNYLESGDLRPPQAVRIIHPFSTPFSPSISGPEVFSNFTFNQTGTNIRALLSESITMFNDARVKSSAREAANLWQLQIIISDGHIGSDADDGVRRLVRKAREEKIVNVFVVVDNGPDSIVDLKEATLDSDGEVKMKRYLEGFPFAYYVVVREIHDLPGVLCRILKGWFEGVVEQG